VATSVQPTEVASTVVGLEERYHWERGDSGSVGNDSSLTAHQSLTTRWADGALGFSFSG